MESDELFEVLLKLHKAFDSDQVFTGETDYWNTYLTEY